MFKKYLSLIPSSGPFYRKPLKSLPGKTGPRYSVQTVGINTLKAMMKTMFCQAGISIEGRNISNHSGKVTCRTTLLNEKYDDKMIRLRTGHTSSAIDNYKRPSKDLCKEISDSLQPPRQKSPNKSVSISTETQSATEAPSNTPRIETLVQQSVTMTNASSATSSTGNSVNSEQFIKYYQLAFWVLGWR